MSCRGMEVEVTCLAWEGTRTGLAVAGTVASVGDMVASVGHLVASAEVTAASVGLAFEGRRNW